MYITRIENVIQEIPIPSVGQSAGNSKVRKGGLHIHTVGKYPENNMNLNGWGGGFKTN